MRRWLIAVMLALNSIGAAFAQQGMVSGGSGPCTTTSGAIQYANNTTFGCVSGWTSNGTGITGTTALTYGGVTLANSVTGTGSMVLSSSPTLVTPVLGNASATTITVANGLAGIVMTAASGSNSSIGMGAGGTVIFKTGSGNDSFAINDSGNSTVVQCTGLLAANSCVFSSAVDSSSTSTGSVQIAGGAVVKKRFWIPAISASAGLQTAVLCQSSGGEMIADSVACLASAARFKDVKGPMPDGALAKLVRLPIDLWSYKVEGQFSSLDWTRERIGPLADDVAAMDPRLAGYDADGNVRTYSTEQLLAFTIKALQEANYKISALESRVGIAQ